MIFYDFANFSLDFSLDFRPLLPTLGISQWESHFGVVTLPWSHLPSHVIILQVILCCPFPSLNWNDLNDISIEAGFEFSVSNLKSTMWFPTSLLSTGNESGIVFYEGITKCQKWCGWIFNFELLGMKCCTRSTSPRVVRGIFNYKTENMRLWERCTV